MREVSRQHVPDREATPDRHQDRRARRHWPRFRVFTTNVRRSTGRRQACSAGGGGKPPSREAVAAAKDTIRRADGPSQKRGAKAALEKIDVELYATNLEIAVAEKHVADRKHKLALTAAKLRQKRSEEGGAGMSIAIEFADGKRGPHGRRAGRHELRVVRVRHLGRFPARRQRIQYTHPSMGIRILVPRGRRGQTAPEGAKGNLPNTSAR